MIVAGLCRYGDWRRGHGLQRSSFCQKCPERSYVLHIMTRLPWMDINGIIIEIVCVISMPTNCKLNLLI